MSEGILSGIVIYGPQARPTFSDNEVTNNGNYHFGIAVRDRETQPDLVRNTCRKNLMSGILLFHR